MYEIVQKTKVTCSKQNVLQRMLTTFPRKMIDNPDKSYGSSSVFKRVKVVKPEKFETHHIIPIAVGGNHWGWNPNVTNGLNVMNNLINLPANPLSCPLESCAGLPYHQNKSGSGHSTYDANVLARINANQYTVSQAVAYGNTTLRPVISAHGAGNLINNIPAANF